ncbi:MAG TPA: hypothetical protein PLA19_02000 [Candidatus Pacearchaeota archaeon]|nr:hypothetical protein [Candidatus Pacearchaeota archaeon]
MGNDKQKAVILKAILIVFVLATAGAYVYFSGIIKVKNVYTGANEKNNLANILPNSQHKFILCIQKEQTCSETLCEATNGDYKKKCTNENTDCCPGLTCEFNDDKGKPYCIKKPSTCGNQICDAGETGANCRQDCCAKEGEVINIRETKRCCEGLVANPNCIGCAQDEWTCRKTYCGNGYCESSKGETAAICPIDCGLTGTCAKEGEVAGWISADEQLHGYYRGCCEGLMQLIDNGYDSRCNERRTWSVTLCVKNCGDGQCTKGENKCNCPQDCK